MDFDVLSIVQLIGGLALFIYGMTTMGKGLERAAGSKLEKTLEKMTGNVITALLMGLLPWSFNLRPQRPLWLSAL